MAVNITITGMAELEAGFARLGKVPQVIVNRGAVAAGKIMLAAAKRYAPEDTGALRRGLINVKEKTSRPGKKVVQVSLAADMNDTFVKRYGPNKSLRAYYPASQEWGWTTGKGTPHERHHQGWHYLREALDFNKTELEETFVKVAQQEIDKALASRR